MAKGGNGANLLALLDAAQSKALKDPNSTLSKMARDENNKRAKAAPAKVVASPVGAPKVKAGLSNGANLLAQMNARPANADAKTMQYITSSNRLNAEAASLDGKPTFEKHKSIFGKVMDVLAVACTLRRMLP